MANLAVPAYEPAPVDIRWPWHVAVPALLVMAYRLIPARVRGWWNPAGTSSSHLALAAILGGGGWAAFERFAFPHMKDGIPWWLDG